MGENFHPSIHLSVFPSIHSKDGLIKPLGSLGQLLDSLASLWETKATLNQPPSYLILPLYSLSQPWGTYGYTQGCTDGISPLYPI